MERDLAERSTALGRGRMCCSSLLLLPGDGQNDWKLVRDRRRAGYLESRCGSEQRSAGG